MTVTSSLAPEWDVYVVALREHAHQLLAWGYSDVRKQLTVAKDEYEMTGLIADGMDDRINSPSTPFHFSLYAIHNEKPTTVPGKLGKRRPRIDIQIERCGIKPKKRFTFEAKRLRDEAACSKTTSLDSYLGTDGVGRFISGYYPSENDEAGMIGCMQAQNADFWATEIANAFDSDTKSGGVLYSVIQPLKVAGVIADLPDERVSAHKRASGLEIQIFHVFLDCQ